MYSDCVDAARLLYAFTLKLCGGDAGLTFHSEITLGAVSDSWIRWRTHFLGGSVFLLIGDANGIPYNVPPDRKFIYIKVVARRSSSFSDLLIHLESS
jgi:hypothetical protein